MLKKYAVIGNPIKQSKSPQIHQEFAKQFGHALSYVRILASQDAFVDTVKDFIKSGGLGMNVTAPFKFQAFELAQSLSARAQSAKSVNTLMFKNNKIFGDNTDGLGLVRDIQENLKFLLKDSRILIIGAGGAASGILLPILEAKPKKMHIINRTVSKAEALAQAFINQYPVMAGGFDSVADLEFDLVINATSASLHTSELPNLNYKFSKNSLAYDLVYGEKPTQFMEKSLQNQATKISDGLGMLLEQAAYSYKLWHGVLPTTQAVFEQIRSTLK